jgi:hypothetical protein
LGSGRIDWIPGVVRSTYYAASGTGTGIFSRIIVVRTISATIRIGGVGASFSRSLIKVIGSGEAKDGEGGDEAKSN